MTNINLMPPVLLAKKKIQWRNILVVGALIIFVVSIGVAWCNQLLEVRRKEKKLEEINAEIQNLQPHLKEIKELEVEIEELKKRLDIITQLDKDRFIWARLLDDMADCIPHGVWIENMANPGGKDLDIKGKAIDNFSIANYMLNLMRSESFTNVNIKSINNITIDEYPARSFALTCTYTI
jgi:type IV pilus assembly protein PilN